MKELSFGGPQGLRLDSFILQQYPALAGGHLHKYLRQNKIKLNGKKQPLSTQLSPGDTVTLYLPPQLPTHPAEVLFEDEGLLAANKPAGLLCMAEAGTEDETADTLLTRVWRHLGYTPGGPGFAPALCHRLDTGTSGLVLVAKNQATLQLVTGLMRRQALEKTYLALSVGHPKPPAALLQGYHVKDAQNGRVYIEDRPRPGAKPVQTSYETIATSGRLALLRITLHTGRTHQIRAHMAGIGTPLLGDSKYGIQKINRELRCRYQCLCAQSIRFPTMEEDAFQAYSGLSISCPPPWFWQQALDGVLK